MDDTSSIGQASAAVAMANDAIDKARRAAASSRNKRNSVAQYDNLKVENNSPDLDLKNNDNAFHVLATLVTERLLPKLEASPDNTHYTLTAEDAAFFQKMLPYSVRRGFVDALRYRLQLLKVGVGSRNSTIGKLTMQCQMLGLDRDNLNALLDLSQSAGMSFPINYKSQGPVAESTKVDPSTTYDQNKMEAQTEAQQQSYNESLTNPLSPSNNDAVETTTSPFAERETSAESMARQQIMAEINETKFLMRGSVTPDAVNFWKNHLEELSQRLVALNLEEQLKAAGCAPGVGEYAPNPNQPFQDDVDMYNKVKTNYEEYIGNSPYHHGEHITDANIEAVASIQKRQADELPVCDVVAPSDLPGGYMFEAQLGSKKFLATVPPGGVTKGQRFVSTMRELETIEIPVPLGAWRDGCRDCFSDGICHPLFLNTLFVPCIALGQIMTRTGLNWQGQSANRLLSSLSCANMAVFLTFWLSMNASAALMLRVAWQRGMEIRVEYWAALIVFNVFVLLYMINLTRKVRGSIRNKYQIPEEHCIECSPTGNCEDCMCATFCMPCAICQMGRHTADFDTYRATCCTKTGLPRQVELAPVTFYEDQYHSMNEDTQGHVI